MGPLLHRFETLLEKGAGAAHIGHPAAVTKTALAAEVLGWIDAARSQGSGPFMGGEPLAGPT
jgi:hypothetical protein